MANTRIRGNAAVAETPVHLGANGSGGLNGTHEMSHTAAHGTQIAFPGNRATAKKRVAVLGTPSGSNGQGSSALTELAAVIAAVERSLAVIEFRMDGTVIRANPLFLGVLGYSLEEIEGQPHSMFVSPEHRISKEYRDFWSALRRGEFQSDEYQRVGKGGKEIWLQATYNPVLDGNGQPYKVIKLATEITEQKRTSADFISQIEAINRSQATIEFDLDGTIRQANENFLATVGYSLGEVKGKPHNMFVEEAYRTSTEYREFWAALRRGEYQSGEFRRVGKGGKEIWLQASYNPILDQSGRVVKVVKFATDITREVQTRHEVAAMVKSMSQTVVSLASSSEEMTAVSKQLSASAAETEAQAHIVSAASDLVSQNVNVVAAGSEEMLASIREISKSATEAARVAKHAVVMADSTNQTISKLGTSSLEIGKVIKVITSIAQQTNLLALNATIEAARAGEAGKGFAVVANEVKELAKETARATEEIGQKIEAIQGDTKAAVEAISQVGAVINQVNDISNTIATAVEEQTATTNEIGRNVTEAAKGTNEIARNIANVAAAAQQTSSGATDTQAAAVSLSEMSAQLQLMVSRLN